MVSGRLKYPKKNRLEYVFLIIGLVFGFAYMLLQPIFIEPDSSFHFESATYLSNTVVDRGSLGFHGEDYQQNFDYFTSEYRQGDYFTKFFKTKLPTTAKENVQDKRVVGHKWQHDLMHVIPAIGIKAAYMIYPSIGVMTIGGRLFNLIFYLLTLFFIIKKLKAYKLIFVMVSVTPTVIQFATSLSYDCYNYIACAFMTATLINIAFDIGKERTVKLRHFLGRLAAPSLMLYFAKMNAKLLYLVAIGILIYLLLDAHNIHISKSTKKKVAILVSFLGTSLFIMKYHRVFGLIAKKIFYTILEPNYKILSTEIIGGTIGSIPLWFYAIQFFVFALVLLGSKEILASWFSYLCLSIAVLNLVAINLSYAISPSFTDRVITGAQGRYYTSFILLLAPVAARIGSRYIKTSEKWVKQLAFSVSVLALILNLSIISVKFYHLQVPADQFRSDVNSMILK